MNQFLFDGSGGGGPPSATMSWAASASGVSDIGSAGGSGTVGFSSGSISSFILEVDLFGKGVVDPLDYFANDIVDYEEIRAESEHRRQHHACGRAHLLPGRPGHQLHFVLQFFEIVLHPSRPSGGFLRHA